MGIGLEGPHLPPNGVWAIVPVTARQPVADRPLHKPSGATKMLLQ